MTPSYTQFAATYSCGTYGSGSFDSNTTCASTSTSGTTDGGTLPSTGTNIIYGLVGGTLLIVIAIALFISSRNKKRKQ